MATPGTGTEHGCAQTKSRETKSAREINKEAEPSGDFVPLKVKTGPDMRVRGLKQQDSEQTEIDSLSLVTKKIHQEDINETLYQEDTQDVKVSTNTKNVEDNVCTKIRLTEKEQKPCKLHLCNHSNEATDCDEDCDSSNYDSFEIPSLEIISEEKKKKGRNVEQGSNGESIPPALSMLKEMCSRLDQKSLRRRTEDGEDADGYSVGSGRLPDFADDLFAEDYEESAASDDIPSLHDDEDDDEQDDYDLFELMDMDPSENEPVEPQYPCNVESFHECCICIEENMLRRRLCCDHPVCDSCIENYLVSLVNQAVVKIECISCESYMHRDEVLQRLPVEMKEKFYKFLVDANKDPFTKTCPRCSFIQKVEKSKFNPNKVAKTESGGKPDTRKVTCSSCSLNWCFPCQAPWHEGVTCKDYAKGDKLLKTWALDYHYGMRNAQKCPKCKVFINKKGGCNHMTCSQCSTNFCYQCGKRHRSLKWFGSHSDRLSPFGCKYNFMPDRPATRRLIRGSLTGAKILAGVGLLGLVVAAGAIVVASGIIILPGYGAYRYHKYRKVRKIRKRIKRQERDLSCMAYKMEEMAYASDGVHPQPRESVDITVDDLFLAIINRSNPQPVEVVVHTSEEQERPLQDAMEGSEVRVVSKDDQGRETVTSGTVEIVTEADGIDGASEVILQVKTSYSEDIKTSRGSTENTTDSTGGRDSCGETSKEVADVQEPPQSESEDSTNEDIEGSDDHTQVDSNGCFIRLFTKHKNSLDKEGAVLLSYRPYQQPDVISSALEVEQQKLKSQNEKLKETLVPPVTRNCHGFAPSAILPE